MSSLDYECADCGAYVEAARAIVRSHVCSAAGLRRALGRTRGRLRALIEALPKCERCPEPRSVATHFSRGFCEPLCDACAPGREDAYEYGYAAALRDALAAAPSTE